MGHENGGQLKNRLLLGGAIHYVRLFACHVTHSDITVTALNKQVPASVRNIV